MRCQICDYDEVTGDSTYADATGYSEDETITGKKLNTKKTFGPNARAVILDRKTGQYLCTLCRRISGAAYQDFNISVLPGDGVRVPIVKRLSKKEEKKELDRLLKEWYSNPEVEIEDDTGTKEG